MSPTWSIRLQTALVVALFLGSLVAVLLSAFQSLTLPQREFQVRDQMREASGRMADAAEVEFAAWSGRVGRGFADLNSRLRAVTQRVLTDFPGVEGGFYVRGGLDRFAGFGFPTDHGDAPPSPPGAVPQPPDEHLGDNPPPKEAPFILLQAENSHTLEPGAIQFDVRTVGPSRVVILTQPVGGERPAPLVVWTMYRMTKPETLEADLHRFQISTGLALVGIALAVVLTLSLGRTLRRQRFQEERLRDELRRAEHLAALGKLLAGVAHEVRNPLAGIRSTVQLWERLPDTARSHDSLRAVVQAVDRLNAIVSRLLQFSRVDRAERQAVQLNDVLAAALKLLEAQAADQGVLVELRPEPNLPPMRGSANALQEAFLNLATNALHAMPGGGRLRCTTRALADRRAVQVEVADTGPGVTAGVREHLFEPFFTTRPDGTGLGLALCREIIVQHGGRVELTAEGPGATFRVVLPTGERPWPFGEGAPEPNRPSGEPR